MTREIRRHAMQRRPTWIVIPLAGRCSPGSGPLSGTDRPSGPVSRRRCQRPGPTSAPWPRSIDRRLAEGWEEAGVEPAAPAGDAEFLRRVSLDIAGRIPPSPRPARSSTTPQPTSGGPWSSGSWPGRAYVEPLHGRLDEAAAARTSTTSSSSRSTRPTSTPGSGARLPRTPATTRWSARS